MKKIYVLFAALFTGLLMSCQLCAPCEHLETEAKTVSLPSCTEAGSGEKICKLCGEVVSTYSIPANGHSFETEAKTVSLPCGHPKCSVCGSPKDECGYGKFKVNPYSICGGVLYLSEDKNKWVEFFSKNNGSWDEENLETEISSVILDEVEYSVDFSWYEGGENFCFNDLRLNICSHGKDCFSDLRFNICFYKDGKYCIAFVKI